MRAVWNSGSEALEFPVQRWRNYFFNSRNEFLRKGGMLVV